MVSVDQPHRYVPLETFERALASLASAVGEGCSPLLLEGGGGGGKTTLLRALAEREHWGGQRVVFSPFLHLPPDDVACWLLHLLGRRAPFGRPADDTFLEDVHGCDGRRTLVLIDEIQCTPAASVGRLAALADAGRPHLILLAAGTAGPKLDAVSRTLGAALRVALPARLPALEMKALCDALLAQPAQPEELQVVSEAAREAIVREAEGVPGLLAAELERRAYDAGVHAARRAAYAAQASARALERRLGEAPSYAHCEPSAAAARSLRSYVPIDPAGAPVDQVDLSRWVARREARPAPAAPRPRRALARAARVRAITAARGRGTPGAAASKVADASAALAAAVAADLRAQRAALVAIGSGVASTLQRAAAAGARGIAALTAAAAPLPGAAASALAARAGAASASLSVALRAARRAALRVDALRCDAVAALRAAGTRLPGPLPATLAAGAIAGAIALAPLAIEPDVAATRAGRSASQVPPASRPAVPTPVALASAEGSRAAVPDVGPSVRVQVNARPWARIRVDGVDVGPTPLSHVRLEPGPHRFEAAFPDGRRLLRVVEIGATQRFVSLP